MKYFKNAITLFFIFLSIAIAPGTAAAAAAGICTENMHEVGQNPVKPKKKEFKITEEY